MPQSDNSTLDVVVTEVGRLETLCNEIELSLRERNWKRLSEALRDTRRTMHAFQNAMADSQPARDAAFDQAVYARLQRIYSVRQEQVDRLRAMHDEIGERLQTLSRWKAYARSIGGDRGRKRGVSLLDMTS